MDHMVIVTSDQHDGGERKYLAFGPLPEMLELAGNIRGRIDDVGSREAYREARLRPVEILKNALAIERYIARLYGDIQHNDAASAMGMCTWAAAEAFLISLNCAPRSYRSAEDADGAIATFIKTMGDAIAMSGIDLDPGSGRWTAAADLLMDMLASLNVVAASVILGAENGGNENIARRIDIEYNTITGCALIAAYAMILCQCIKDGAYRGQTLRDLRR